MKKDCFITNVKVISEKRLFSGAEVYGLSYENSGIEHIVSDISPNKASVSRLCEKINGSLCTVEDLQYIIEDFLQYDDNL